MTASCDAMPLIAVQQARGLRVRQLHMASAYDGCNDDGFRKSTYWFYVCSSRICFLTYLRYCYQYRLWHYNPENDDQKGDDWNGENFSWFSRKRALPLSLLHYEQDAPSLDNGGRILDAIVRPYPAKTAGIPISFEYEMNTGAFSFVWDNRDECGVIPKEKTISDPPRTLQTPLTSRETEIFIPSQLTLGRQVVVQGLKEADRWSYDGQRQTLFILTENKEPRQRHQIVVSVYPPLRTAFFVNDIWSDFGGHFIAIIFAIFSILMFWGVYVYTDFLGT